jgi:hypothetical protein
MPAYEQLVLSSPTQEMVRVLKLDCEVLEVAKVV